MDVCRKTFERVHFDRKHMQNPSSDVSSHTLPYDESSPTCGIFGGLGLQPPLDATADHYFGEAQLRRE
jgi:hypothetical protein